MDCFELEELFERLDGQPGRWHDVGAALALEQDGEPEGEGGALRGDKGCGWALWVRVLVRLEGGLARRTLGVVAGGGGTYSE